MLPMKEKKGVNIAFLFDMFIVTDEVLVALG